MGWTRDEWLLASAPLVDYFGLTAAVAAAGPLMQQDLHLNMEKRGRRVAAKHRKRWFATRGPISYEREHKIARLPLVVFQLYTSQAVGATPDGACSAMARTCRDSGRVRLRCRRTAGS